MEVIESLRAFFNNTGNQILLAKMVARDVTRMDKLSPMCSNIKDNTSAVAMARAAKTI